MGLMDVLNGMQHGPRGPRGPSPSRQRRRHVADDHGDLGPACLQSGEKFHEPAGCGACGAGQAGAPGSSQSAGPGGGLGDILKSGLGGLLAGGAAGSVLSGGLNDLLKQFQQSGNGDVAKTWVDNGPNKAISSDDLAKALGGDQISTLMAHTGLSRQDLLAGLSQYLPEAVNHLTPDGRLPTEQELSRSL